MSELSSIDQVMIGMPAVFQPEQAGNTAAVVQFHITGEQSGDWIVDIRDGRCETRRGIAAHPNVTLHADSRDLLDLLNGRLEPMAAFMRGKLQLRGDVTLAMRLPTLFRRD